MTKEQIRAVVRETVHELVRAGVVGKYDSSAAYNEIVGRLREYYKNGESDREIALVLRSVEEDPYFRIIPLWFLYSYTNEKLAEYYDCDVSTISRNKKRLCLAIYDALQ